MDVICRSGKIVYRHLFGFRLLHITQICKCSRNGYSGIGQEDLEADEGSDTTTLHYGVEEKWSNF
jgi:hypothetical protein